MRHRRREAPHLQFLPTDAGRLVPVEFGVPNRAACQANPRSTLPLPPTSLAVPPLKASSLTNPSANGERLDSAEAARSGPTKHRRPRSCVTASLSVTRPCQASFRSTRGLSVNFATRSWFLESGRVSCHAQMDSRMPWHHALGRDHDVGQGRHHEFPCALLLAQASAIRSRSAAASWVYRSCISDGTDGRPLSDPGGCRRRRASVPVRRRSGRAPSRLRG